MKKKLYFVVSVLILCGALTLIYFLYFNDISQNQTFGQDIVINGVNVGGLNAKEASKQIKDKLETEKNNFDLTLCYGEKNWTFCGKDFALNQNVDSFVEDVFEYCNCSGLDKLLNKHKQTSFLMPYDNIFEDFDSKLIDISNDINCEPKDSQMTFDAQSEEGLIFSQEEYGKIVDIEKLKEEISNAMRCGTSSKIEIPIIEIKPQVLKEDLQKTVVLRGEFSTSYISSSKDRKFNVKHALDQFNGMIVLPEQEISFNQTTGARTKENGYKMANIILNGEYVEGSGGGVCQASTTLYNALLLADTLVTEVHKHTLPSSYIDLAFDAMVSEGISDLKFVNSTNNNLYIITSCDNKNATVKIFGEPIKDNMKIVRRTEFLGSIPHPGDKIVPDIDGKYANKVTFKGEYLRIKYPKEGYKAQAYLDYYIDDVLVDSKLIRTETYKAQEGIIIEGTEEVVDGICLPPNTVKFIGPQENSNVNEKNIQKKIENDNPSSYNP